MKFSGKIGFWIKDVQIIEKEYTGDVLRNIRRFQSVENQQNENLAVNNKLSIISDLYLQQNWGSIKYVFWNGVNWRVSSVDVGSLPRIVLQLGGVYNGKTVSS